MPCSSLTESGRQHGYRLIPRMVGIVKIFLHFMICRRTEWRTIAPAHLLEIGIYLIERSVKHIIRDSLSCLCRRILILRNRCSERLNNLWPCHFTCIFHQLLFCMWSKGTGIDGYTQHRHTIIAGGVTCLLIKTWSCNYDRRNAKFFGNNTRPRFLRSTDAATTISCNNRIYL